MKVGSTLAEDNYYAFRTAADEGKLNSLQYLMTIAQKNGCLEAMLKSNPKYRMNDILKQYYSTLTQPRRMPNKIAGMFFHHSLCSSSTASSSNPPTNVNRRSAILAMFKLWVSNEFSYESTPSINRLHKTATKINWNAENVTLTFANADIAAGFVKKLHSFVGYKVEQLSSSPRQVQLDIKSMNQFIEHQLKLGAEPASSIKSSSEDKGLHPKEHWGQILTFKHFFVQCVIWMV